MAIDERPKDNITDLTFFYLNGATSQKDEKIA